LQYSFRHHYENNRFYRKYCETEKISPEDIRQPADLTRIPLIPDKFFKDYPPGTEFIEWLGKIATGGLPDAGLSRLSHSFQRIMEALEREGMLVTFTSGTSGRFSFFPRSRLTWARQQCSFAYAMLTIIGEVFDPGRLYMQVAPHPLKTYLFIGKITVPAYGILCLAENATFLMDRWITPDSVRLSSGKTHGIKEWFQSRLFKAAGARLVETFVRKLELNARKGQQLVLGGPPALINSVFSRLEEKGRSLDLGEKGTLITGGGWKLSGANRLTQTQWRHKAQKILGIPDERCRDIYAMSECSAVFPECEGHYKHVPHSIVYPVVLGDDLKPVGYGQWGRFAFLDPLPASYPGFILTGDRVKLLESCPVCHRIGPVIDSEISRMPGMENRGCAGIVAGLIAEDINEIRGN
jgi:hypothetical protein